MTVLQGLGNRAMALADFCMTLDFRVEKQETYNKALEGLQLGQSYIDFPLKPDNNSVIQENRKSRSWAHACHVRWE